MSSEEARLKLYNLSCANRKLRRRMTNSLKLTRDGQYEQASAMLKEAKHDFDQMKREQKDLLKDSVRRSRCDFESSMDFTEVFHDSIAQANRLHSRNCSAVKFHVYN